MRYVARLPADLDPQMTLFQLRRVGATADFDRPSAAEDVQVTGDVPDDKVDALAEALAPHKGALHVGDRHFKLAGAAEEVDDIPAAEEHLGGPFTVIDKPRSAWAFGDPARDHVVQVLYFAEDHMQMRDIVETTGLRPELVMKAMKQLTNDDVVRKFRKPGDLSPTGETFGLAREVKSKIASTKN